MSEHKLFEQLLIDDILSHAERVASTEQDEVSLGVEEEIPVLPSGFQPVPCTPLSEDLSNFYQAFKPALFMEHLYYPIYIDQELLNRRLEAGEDIAIEELNQRYLYVQHETEDGLMPFNPVYTDPRLFETNTTYQAGAIIDVLEFFLYDQHSSGIAINPPSRAVQVAPEQVTFLSKDSIASLIGMLQSGGKEPAVGKAFHTAVLEADLEEDLYQVIYYWNRSYRTPRVQDDCTLVYLEKLRACWRLDYPGARERSAQGLQWLMDYDGTTEERQQAWHEWRSVLAVN
jgi:hypothetical protein